MKLLRSLLMLLLMSGAVVTNGWSQSATAPAYAFDNVIIHKADGSTVSSGSIVWREGIIKTAGDDAEIPFDAYVIDGGDSLHVYPGFLDGLALWGSPDLPDRYDEPERPGAPGYERAGIQPQRQPSDLLKTDDEALKDAQKHGFTSAALGLKGQMLPGQIDLFFINGGETDEYLYRQSIGMQARFDEAPGGWGSGAYPATLMGVMAKYRQLWYDAEALKTQVDYYASKSDDYPAPRKNAVLEALFPVLDRNQPLYFVVDTKENIERLFWLQDELGFEAVVVSGKEAYRQAEELVRRNIPVLASIDLPEKPEWKVKTEEAAADTSETEKDTEIKEITEEMRIFREKQLAAYQASVDNIRKLLESGVRVGYASNGMKLEDFGKHIRALEEEGGLSSGRILAMLTGQTADILGVGRQLGELKSGRIASFSVYTKPFTNEKTQVKYSVSNGRMSEYEITSSDNDNGKEN